MWLVYAFMEVTVEVAYLDATHLQFLNGIDQAEGDEARAFNDLTVIAGFGEQTLLAENWLGGAISNG
jgi:hypothetical protein